MIDKLVEETTELNQNATLLLQKYDGVFSKMSEESQKILLAMAQKSEEGLSAITTLLESGNVAQAENALKLEGKSLDEILESSSNTVLQIVSNSTNAVTTTTSKSGFEALKTEIIPKKASSKFMVTAIINGMSGDDSIAFMEYSKNGGVWIKDTKLNGDGTNGGVGDFAWSHLSNGGNHTVAVNTELDVGTDVTNLKVRIRCTAENNAGGGFHLNHGTTSSDSSNYNYDRAKTTLTLTEIGR